MIVGVGIDLVDVARARRLFEGKGTRATARLFTEREVRYAMQRADPAPHFAARLAAKEAAFKALSGNTLARGIGWREIEVVSGTDGAPAIELHGSARQRADELGVARLWLTLTHTALTAGAVVVLERGERPADLACPARRAERTRQRAVRRHPTSRHAPHQVIDLCVELAHDE
jgi:holo-[acyl-carrier protein] synthase